MKPEHPDLLVQWKPIEDGVISTYVWDKDRECSVCSIIGCYKLKTNPDLPVGACKEHIKEYSNTAKITELPSNHYF